MTDVRLQLSIHSFKFSCTKNDKIRLVHNPSRRFFKFLFTLNTIFHGISLTVKTATYLLGRTLLGNVPLFQSKLCMIGDELISAERGFASHVHSEGELLSSSLE